MMPKPMKVQLRNHVDTMTVVEGAKAVFTPNIIEEGVYMQVVPNVGDEMEINNVLYRVLSRTFHFRTERDGGRPFHIQTAQLKIRKVDISGSLYC